jgi:ankyrin repeat protein
LQEIKERNWEFAQRLLQCVAVVSRPLRVEELAEFLAFDFKAGLIPKFREDWRPDDPLEAVMSTCSTLLALVNVDNSQVIQFSHFSVKEFLSSIRFSEKCDTLSRRYHVSMAAAHAVVTRACLGILMHLDENVTRIGLKRFSLVEYAAEHWFEHARFEGVSQNIEEGIKQLFGANKPHLAVWIWLYEPNPRWRGSKPTERPSGRPSKPRRSPMDYTIFCGLHAIVKLLAIERPQDVHSQDLYDKSTPLHLASAQGHVEVARVLFECGADLTTRDIQGWTPLHHASRRGNLKVARFLVEHGTDVTAEDEDGSSPLHVAAQCGKVEVAQFLVEHGADVKSHDRRGSTPLHHASLEGKLEVARFLVERGADATVQNKNGSTPLHHALFEGNLGVARFLIEQGADVTAQNKRGSTLLHQTSLQKGADASVQSERGAIVTSFLIDHGADVSAQDKDGSTPLHLASRSGNVEVARLLVMRGADVTAQDKDRSTPLHQASQLGKVEVAQLLVEHGADVTARDKDGSTPLHRVSKGKVEVMCSSLDDKYKPGWDETAQKCVEVAQILIAHNADATAQDNQGLTPIQWARLSGKLDLARFLVSQSGAATT